MPVNQYNMLTRTLPEAELVFTQGWMHELLSVHSAEELDCIRQAGKLCEDAMKAMVERARPGVTEYQLRAAAGAAIMEGGGDIDFLIIGTTRWRTPRMVFGNPRPSGRKLQKGDIINMELAAGYRGYTAQIGSPICSGRRPTWCKRFWDEITLPGFEKMAAAIKPGNPVDADPGGRQDSSAQRACSRGRSTRTASTSITDGPHVFSDGVHAEPFEQVFKPGMVFMAEPNPITADGKFGIFVGPHVHRHGDGQRVRRQVPVGDGGGVTDAGRHGA